MASSPVKEVISASSSSRSLASISCPDASISLSTGGKTRVKPGQKLRLTCTLAFSDWMDANNVIAGIGLDDLKFKNSKLRPLSKGVSKKAQYMDELNIVWWQWDSDFAVGR